MASENAKEGRPTVMTEESIAKLEEAFSNGATDLEACFLAKISKDSLYRYQQEHPEFCERKDALKEMIKYQAKKVVKEAIEEGDKQQANWYLERKGKDEGFNPRTEITGKDGEELKVQPVLVKFLNESQDDRNSSGV